MTTMNKWTPTTDLLTLRRMGKLLEELGEASNVAARVIIQGIDEVDPGSGKVNRERLENELADVQAQIGCTVLAFDLDQDRMARRTAEKMRQMAEWEALFSPADAQAPSEPFEKCGDCKHLMGRGTMRWNCRRAGGACWTQRSKDGQCGPSARLFEQYVEAPLGVQGRGNGRLQQC